MITPKQRAWYWREWAAVVRAARANQWPVPDRHHLHRVALAEYRRQRGIEPPDRESLNDLTNREFDLVIAEFQARSRSSDIGPQIRQLKQPTTRMLWKIQMDLPRLLATVLDAPDAPDSSDPIRRANAYISSILKTKYRAADPSDLSFDQLSLLITDVTRAINQRRRARGLSWPDLRAAADQLFGSLGSDIDQPF